MADSRQAHKAGRRYLAVSGACHAVLKVLAGIRGVTLKNLVEELLFDGLAHEIARDPSLEPIVRQVVQRGERTSEGLRKRTLSLLADLEADRVADVGELAKMSNHHGRS